MKARILLFVLVATACQASLIANDSFDWTKNFGPGGEDYSNTVADNSLATSKNGVQAIVSFDGGNHTGLRIDQGPHLGGYWYGNFSLGDELLSAYETGPVSFSFSRKILGIGANIQADYFGPFTAQLCDTNRMCVSENGVSNDEADGSAIYIGLSDPAGFTGATFSLTSCAEDCTDFAINQMEIMTNPEPGSAWLLLAGVLLVGQVQRHR